MPTEQKYEEFLKTIKKKAPKEYGNDVSVGDKVTFINDNGVAFPGNTVIGFADEPFNGRFIYLDYECWWFPVRWPQLIMERKSLASLALLEIELLTLQAIIDLKVDDGTAADTLMHLEQYAMTSGYSSDGGENYYLRLELPEELKNSFVSSFESGCEARYESLSLHASESQLSEEWNQLDLEAQEEIYHQFQMDCINGGAEPDPYWYSLLMPRQMKDYVGD